MLFFPKDMKVFICIIRQSEQRDKKYMMESEARIFLVA